MPSSHPVQYSPEKILYTHCCFEGSDLIRPCLYRVGQLAVSTWHLAQRTHTISSPSRNQEAPPKDVKPGPKAMLPLSRSRSRFWTRSRFSSRFHSWLYIKNGATTTLLRKDGRFALLHPIPFSTRSRLLSRFSLLAIQLLAFAIVIAGFRDADFSGRPFS